MVLLPATLDVWFGVLAYASDRNALGFGQWLKRDLEQESKIDLALAVNILIGTFFFLPIVLFLLVAFAPLLATIKLQDIGPLAPLFLSLLFALLANFLTKK
jgi:hypothetical protein